MVFVLLTSAHRSWDADNWGRDLGADEVLTDAKSQNHPILSLPGSLIHADANGVD